MGKDQSVCDKLQLEAKTGGVLLLNKVIIDGKNVFIFQKTGKEKFECFCYKEIIDKHV